RDSIETLTSLAAVPPIRRFALHALSDHRADAGRVPDRPFVEGLTDADPRVRLQAVIGLGRLGKGAGASAIVERTADDDPLVAHVAVQALVALNAVSACLDALDPATPRLAPGAARALQAMHTAQAVDGLIAKLEKSSDAATHRLVFNALCRLDHREADYTGDWWTTRPDTSGPYYKPVTWAETPKIERALEGAFERADKRSVSSLLVELVRNKVELKATAAVDFDFAGLEPSNRAVMVDILGGRRSLPDKAIRFLDGIAASDQEAPALRVRALKGLVRQDRRSAAGIMAVIGHQEKPAPELLDAWREYLRDGGHPRRLGDWRTMAQDKDPARRELAYAVLLAVDANPRTFRQARADAERAIESAGKSPSSTASLLRAIGQTDSVKYAFQVKNGLKSSDPEVKSAAVFAAQRLDLDGEGDGPGRGPTIASLPFETVVAAATSENGDAPRGERLFLRQGCAACHTVASGAPPKGPSLAGIAQRYNRAALAESILKPSAKLAQGFEPQKFATVDGRTFDGFVVRESGDEVECRDAQGSVFILPKKEIDARAKGDVSIMPTGLIDALTVHDLASLLTYLESLKSK
ncbi:MAG TPA: c-type cytochrome, partial [Isosphaeraceae bacterium]|nr:c-type cytochrome [Isosphaeraceae bacterium]